MDVLPDDPAEVGIFDSGDFYRCLYHRYIDEPNPARMPDLDTFFGFGGTLELLTRDLTLAEKS